MKAKDLKAGDFFKYDSVQRKSRRVIKVVAFDQAMPPNHDKGDLLIILEGCGQIVLKPDHEVIALQ